MPTRTRETFGLAVLEALTSGLPVVIPDYAMLADEVVAGGFGLACNPHDTEALAADLSRLAQNDELVAAMSRRAHSQARRLAPTPEEWADPLLALYAEILGRGGSPARTAVVA